MVYLHKIIGAVFDLLTYNEQILCVLCGQCVKTYGLDSQKRLVTETSTYDLDLSAVL